MLWRVIVLSGLGLALCVGWSVLTHPAPWGSQPLQLKWSSWKFIQSWNLARLGARYGLWDETKTIRGLWPPTVQTRVKEERTTIAGIPVIIYYPNERRDKTPGLVNFHGGGFIIGSADIFAHSLGRYAEELQAVVVSVEYPMQPEATAKELYKSCYKVATYFIQHASNWGVDPNLIALIGESAGGNIAASVNLQMRDNNFQPMPRLQVLLQGLYQMIDVQLPSFIQGADGPIMTRDVINFFYNHQITHDPSKYFDIVDQNRHVPIYVRRELAKDHLSHDFIPQEQQYPPYNPPQYQEADMDFWNKFKDVIMDPYVNPLIAESHANLSEAIIMCAQYDNIRDDSFLYARRLRNDGVPVVFYNHPIGTHVIQHFSDLEDGEHYMKHLIKLLKEKLV